MTELGGTINKYLEKVLWTVLVGVVGLGVSILKDMNINMNLLNEKLAAVVERLSYQGARLDNLNSRIDRLEDKSHE